jgi:phosphopentomutase
MDEMQSIVSQVKKLGTHFYMLTGGEPLIRKKDIITLALNNPECTFLIYTNATLVDKELCDNIKKCGNITLALSVEGDECSNDDRRGEGAYKRTENRHDFSLTPPAPTAMDAIGNAGLDVISIGKIYDIFSGAGIKKSLPTHNNREGMQTLLEVQKTDFRGLCFANLVDFDMLYGHRQDIDGYAKALSEFDAWLPEFMAGMEEGDVLMITADHGCDPGDNSTDHTREMVPLIIYGSQIKPCNMETHVGFANIGKLACDLLKVEYQCDDNTVSGVIL